METETKQPMTLKSTKDIALSDNYPFTIGQIRYFLTNRHKNGLANAVRKIGKRIYFRIDLFDAWIDKQGRK